MRRFPVIPILLLCSSGLAAGKSAERPAATKAPALIQAPLQPATTQPIVVTPQPARISPTPSVSPEVDRQRKRLDIAQREAALVQQRLDKLVEEVTAVREFLDDAGRAAVDPALAAARNLPVVMPAPIDLSGEELAAALERAETRTRELRAAMGRINTAIKPYDFPKLQYKILVKNVAAQVAEIRGLPLKHSVDSIVVSREGIKEVIGGLLAKELTDKVVRGEELTWRALNILPPDADLRVLYSGLLEEQVGGLYNDANQSLYVVDTFDPKSFLGRVILSHEICHAIQDQHFPIKDLPFRTKNDDQNMSVSAVLEGDATLLMMEWGQKNFQTSDLLGLTDWMNQGTEQLENVPPPLVQSLVYPYIGGLKFMQALQLEGAADARNLPFKRPPQSSEQILHPEKYYPTPDEPVEVALPDWKPKDGLEQVRRGVVGEWTTRLVLTPPESFPKLTAFNTEMLANEPVATNGAAGWGGDMAVTVADEGNKHWFVAWKSAWDRSSDVDEFQQAFERRVAQWTGFSASGDHQWSNADGRTATFARKADTTLVFVASDAATLNVAQDWAKF